jgi:hypothetical protein
MHLFVYLGFNFHLEFRHYKFRSLLWFFSNFCINKLIHLYSLNKPFSLILMYFHMNYNCFVDEFYHKTKKVCKKGATCKENKTTLISLLSRGRMTSADIGREFRPLLLVWWALLINLWFFKLGKIGIPQLKFFREISIECDKYNNYVWIFTFSSSFFL